MESCEGGRAYRQIRKAGLWGVAGMHNPHRLNWVEGSWSKTLLFGSQAILYGVAGETDSISICRSAGFIIYSCRGIFPPGSIQQNVPAVAIIVHICKRNAKGASCMYRTWHHDDLVRLCLQVHKARGVPFIEEKILQARCRGIQGLNKPSGMHAHMIALGSAPS